jgi:hypothetical protein
MKYVRTVKGCIGQVYEEMRIHKMSWEGVLPLNGNIREYRDKWTINSQGMDKIVFHFSFHLVEET